MLKKLLKYDIKTLNKVLIIFYSLSIFFAVLTRIFFAIEGSLIMNIIAKICSGVTISMMFNIVINNLMRLWVRFKQNLYSDESYLTHTLPVKKETLYLSKTITSFVTLFISVVVIALSLFIAYYSKENIEILKTLVVPLATMYDSTFMKILLMFMLVFFLEFANILQSGFTGIILGNKMNNSKTGFSVLYGFLTYLSTQVFVLLVTFIVAIFNKDMMNLFITNEIINIDMIKLAIYIALFCYTTTLTIIYILNIKLFKKGVNID